MKPVDQTILHDPANGLYGDCWRAVLASLLELPIEDVPHFAAEHPLQEDAVRALNDWLRPRGLAFLDLGVNAESKEFFQRIGIRDLFHDMSGPSPRYPDERHATVGKDLDVIHDPHPDRAGIVGKEVGDVTIGVFICLDPARFIDRTIGSQA